MSGRTGPGVAAFARKLVPVNHGQGAVERSRKAIRDRTVHLGSVESSPITPAALWQYGKDRARGRRVHGFTFLSDWLGAIPQLDSEETASVAGLLYELVRDWDERFGRHRDSAPEMAFHDETTAQRLLGIVGALDRFTLEPAQREYLMEFASRTAELVSDPDFYGGLNNHGMFQDISLLAWSVLIAPENEALGTRVWELATERLHAYFSTCFTSEGVHVENTPTYHVMVARYLPILEGLFARAGSTTAKLYSELLPGAVDYAVHCVTPEGIYPPVSDTHRRRLDTPQNLKTFQSSEFEFAASAGARGTPPAARTVAFPESGYAMTRSAWGNSNATFVHFTCAYNADYHKHSDEQSVYLRSGGRDLLCEAGPYGYNWRDPFTKYAYSSAAHNSLLVGGAGLPRTEQPHARNDAVPALNQLEIDCGEGDLLDVTGTTRRYNGRVWRRHLRVAHGERAEDSRLTIADSIQSSVGAEKLRFLWHIGAGLRADLRTEGVEVFDCETKVMEIEFRAEVKLAVRLLEGAEEPTIQGWHFPDFGRRVPAPVIIVEARAADILLTTEVRLSGFVWSRQSSGSALVPAEMPGKVCLGGQPISTWGSPGTSKQSVLLLSGYAEDAHRIRFAENMAKTEHEVCHIANIAALNHSEQESAELTLEQSVSIESAFDKIVRTVVDHIRSRAIGGVKVTVATVGAGFYPGAVGALENDAPLIVLDPVLPRTGHDLQTWDPANRVQNLVEDRPNAQVELLVSHENVAGDDRMARMLLGPNLRTYPVTSGLLRADVEDALSGMLLNALDVASKSAMKCLALYDRRAGVFIVEVPDAGEVEVSVRVFRGREEVLTMPYTVGASHRLPYSGATGPHRLRIHIRGPKLSEAAAFTTRAIRVR